MEYHCPNCGAPIEFRSKVSIYTTCTYCRSTIVRRDMDLEKIGEVGELLNDMSPFQVGTTGVWQERGFRLLGRIKVGYKGGMWSEWYALFNDNTVGWLGEAQGQYMMSFPVEDYAVPDYHTLRVGTHIAFRGTHFSVADRRKIRYLASEGELPYVFQPKFQGGSIDLKGQDNSFLNFLYGPQGSEAFLGAYAPFDTFQFKDLRTLNGWT